ncbi:hypothetical protein D3C71_1344850 [compost metagenome]
MISDPADPNADFAKKRIDQHWRWRQSIYFINIMIMSLNHKIFKKDMSLQHYKNSVDK